MKPVEIHLIAAARPNFMKIAPLYHALRKESWVLPRIVHTGQHYDLNMSEAFFQDLQLPEPDIHLGVGSGSHAQQTGKVMIAYEAVLQEHQPHMVVVVGDVNSTVACALAASKMYFKNGIGRKGFERPIIAHLEAGLRSFDRTMPEEINRVVTDVLSDVLWTPSPDADENLIREGIDKEKIHRVGNIMIDSFEMLRHRIEQESLPEQLELEPGTYGVVTLHRPSNVDVPERLGNLCEHLIRVSQKVPLVFPVHPRTRRNLQQFGFLELLQKTKTLRLLEPLGYIQFMSLVLSSRLVITDSGGIQEETTYLGIPCLTLRPNTERPITLTLGTNRLVCPEDLEQWVDRVLEGEIRLRKVPDLWDGETASRVVQSIYQVIRDRGFSEEIQLGFPDIGGKGLDQK